MLQLLTEPPGTMEGLRGATADLAREVGSVEIDWVRGDGQLTLAIETACALIEKESTNGVINIPALLSYTNDGVDSFRDAGLSQADAIVFTAGTIGSRLFCDSPAMMLPDVDDLKPFDDIAGTIRRWTEE